MPLEISLREGAASRTNREPGYRRFTGLCGSLEGGVSDNQASVNQQAALMGGLFVFPHLVNNHGE